VRKVVLFVTLFVLIALLIAGITGLSSVSLSRRLGGSVADDKSALLGLKIHNVRAVAGDAKRLSLFTFTNNKKEKLLKVDVECLSDCETIQKIQSGGGLRSGDSQTVELTLVSAPTPGTYHPVFGITARWTGSYLVTQRQVEMVIRAPTATPGPPVKQP